MTGRVLWVIWCLFWAGVWAVLALFAWTGVAATWQLVLFPALAGGSVAALWLPVGKPRAEL